jgi:predicted nucleic acid-binding protein
MIAVDTNLLVYAHRSDSDFHERALQAVCIQYSVSELWTADRDFSRFAGLKTRNPLIGQQP